MADDDDDEGVHLVDADLGLHVLKAFLQDGDERSRRHQSPVDVRLTDVTLDAKRERRVREPCSTETGFPSTNSCFIYTRVTKHASKD